MFHSTQQTPMAVLQLLESILPGLSLTPLSPVTQTKVADLCQGLKQVGRDLEISHGRTLDSLQQSLTLLCQNSGLPILLRLQILEVIELRSLGWRTNPTVESYYRERFNQFTPTPPAIKVAKQNAGQLVSSPSLCPIAERSNTAQKQPNEDFLVVNGAKLHLRSANPAAVSRAKAVLDQYFNQPTPPRPKVRYTREEILCLSSSSSAQQPPNSWDCIVKHLPSVVVRQSCHTSKCNRPRSDGDRLKNQIGGGDLPLPVSLPSISRPLPLNLPINST